MSLLDKAVSRDEDGTWRAECPVTDPADKCGDPATGVRFLTVGWDSKEHARQRLDEHIAEHKGEAQMSSLDEFRSARGLVPHADGIKVVKAVDL